MLTCIFLEGQDMYKTDLVSSSAYDLDWLKHSINNTN